MEKENMKNEGSALKKEDNDNQIVKLKQPVEFERESYEKIDLAGLHDIKAADMIRINRKLSKSGNVDTTQEVTLEYALNMANIVTGLPLEFFEQLPPYAALAIRSRVMGFLFGVE